MTSQELIELGREWSDSKFDNGNFTPERSVPISLHLKKEVIELTDALKDYFNNPTDDNKKELLFEFADCYLLLGDCATHAGFTMKEIKDAEYEKLQINKTRKWKKPDINGIIEHIKNN
jgi:NTP pyrophosphatase (non-canonical NTP hydrolase)